eukprot:scaffold5454_cov112-Isochrysis_galbana.AAC.2
MTPSPPPAAAEGPPARLPALPSAPAGRGTPPHPWATAEAAREIAREIARGPSPASSGAAHPPPGSCSEGRSQARCMCGGEDIFPDERSERRHLQSRPAEIRVGDLAVVVHWWRRLKRPRRYGCNGGGGLRGSEGGQGRAMLHTGCCARG